MPQLLDIFRNFVNIGGVSESVIASKDKKLSWHQIFSMLTLYPGSTSSLDTNHYGRHCMWSHIHTELKVMTPLYTILGI